MKKLTPILLITLLSPILLADDQPILVEEKGMMSPAESLYPIEAQERFYSDGGDFLSNLPGVTGSRFGGHGIDPIIRGQGQDQLNVTLDDAFIFGGCPNRMDPPTAYANLSSYEEVIVTKGYQSVLNGPGASGGSVQFKTGRPNLGQKSYGGEVATQYDTNSNQSLMRANVATGSSRYYFKANGSHRYSNNYDDGDGKEVRSSFEENNYGISMGVTPQSGDHYKVSVQRHEVLDALFPGAGMDSPFSETTNISVQGTHLWKGPKLKSSKLSLYRSDVDHQMDNFSLRPAGMAYRRVDSTSETTGLKLKNDLHLFGIRFENAIEYRKNERNASRFQGTNATNVTTLQSSMWPGISIAQYGLALEGSRKISQTKLVAGVRADHYTIDYATADVTSSLTNRSANDLYRQFYGYGSLEQDETNIGGLIRFEHALKPSLTLKAGLSRSLRTADATERGLANDMVVMGNNRSWVGNPLIAPEEHHQVDVAALYRHKKAQVGLSLYYNKVNNYILRDSARGQAGILLNAPNADVYTNVDAYLAGAEFESQVVLNSWTQLDINFFYTYGKNETYDLALAQVPAFQGRLAANLKLNDAFVLTPSLDWALRQNRIDSNTATGSGRDIRATPGYTIWNLAASYSLQETLVANIAVTNIFDKKYANHLNRSNISDSTEVQVFEPGRSFTAGLSYRF